ncbi:site-specific integrase [Paenibacillus yanchengensis]|uniref:Site-specific integrase n=1 Tax=Paenibacillus yanchengensis TaxID=2035833 RepID=A0ABW4YJB8_9BACL
MKKDLSKRTIQIIHATVDEALELALLHGKIKRNPCKGSKIQIVTNNKECTFIESDKITHFLQEARADGYTYWIFFKLLIETGLRKGEAAALKWSDINFKDRLITIDETSNFQPDHEDELFGKTKTKNSSRTIAISTSIINDLKYHLTWQNQNKITLGESKYRHDLNLVLCRVDGNPMPKSSLWNSFKRILKRADLSQDLTIHSLRHTYAVLMLEADADMKFIQEQLGHGSIQITSDVYAHITKKLQQNNITKYASHTAQIFNLEKNKVGGRSGDA